MHNFDDIKHKVLDDPELVDSLLEVFPELRLEVFQYLKTVVDEINIVASNTYLRVRVKDTVAETLQGIKTFLSHVSDNIFNIKKLSLEVRTLLHNNTSIVTVYTQEFADMLSDFNHLKVVFTDKTINIPTIWSKPTIHLKT